MAAIEHDEGSPGDVDDASPTSFGRLRAPAAHRRRSFGKVRHVPGRPRAPWVASYALDGVRGSRRVSRSFGTQRDANSWLALQEVAVLGGTAVDPRRGRLTIADYVSQWLDERVELAPRTRETYRCQIRPLLFRAAHGRGGATTAPAPVPYLGTVPLARLTTSQIRAWRAAAIRDGATPHTVARAYQRLRAVCATAVADGLIARTPCTIEGAGDEQHAERPIATVAEVARLADAMPDRLRIAVLLASWCQMRRGEILALRRLDVDLDAGTIHIARSAGELTSGARVEGAPKGGTGRVVALPPHVRVELEGHLKRWVAADPSALMLTGEKGGALRPAGLQDAWAIARESVGRPDLHLHDLRHAGATWAATTGASIRELMALMGHRTERAALIYQHRVAGADKTLAEALSTLAAPASTASHVGAGSPARRARAVRVRTRRGRRG